MTHPITVDNVKISPAARRLILENNLDPASITPTGRGALITKPDVIHAIRSGQAKASAKDTPAKITSAIQLAGPGIIPADRLESSVPSLPVSSADQTAAVRGERQKMSPLRAALAKRLVEAKNAAVMLTTFAEVDMSLVIRIRRQHQETFQRRNGIKLGYISFFVKAVCDALQRHPAVNSSVDGDDIILHKHYDIGIAVSTDSGLLVPVVRGADKMTFAEIEHAVADLAHRAQTNKIELDEIQGGTFTISNGGMFGALLTTPLLNPPQSATLGMHAIQQRAIVIEDKNGAEKVEIRPMMYLALSYDHRVIDGKESVEFLNRIKECLENPERMLLEM
ncbi:2-oxo acid dehydrogenase subunit E2 [Candidatus Sumerlaeota bacterium]|nr:2-oxo acid dehydrogenase subunit E2 [Candidatus Sumerlaeota bacterium]